MKGFQDPYKSEGIFQLKIEKLSEFAQGELNSKRYSDTIYVRGLPWKIVARDMQQYLIVLLECCLENTGLAWSCTCSSVRLKVLAQKEGKEDYVRKFISKDFNFNDTKKAIHYLTYKNLMNPEKGWYDEVTDSIILQVQIAANAPHGVENMPDDAYTRYTMHSEQALFVDLKDGSNCQSSTKPIAIEDKLWSFNYAPSDKMLYLEMAMHELDASRTTAECIFWYWNDKEIAIFKKMIHTFGETTITKNNADSGMKFSRIAVPTKGSIPVNKKFGVVVRLLDEDEQKASANNSLDAYYGNYEGVETVKLEITSGIKTATFVVPKLDLIRASPVFERMFANEMTEKATGKVEIKDTNAEDFGDFLKAISPRQEHPNPSNVFALLILADRYQCQLLRDRCELHLMNCLEIPFIHRITCANYYGLNKLKNNLMVSLDGTGLSKLLQQTDPYFGILKELRRKRK